MNERAVLVDVTDPDNPRASAAVATYLAEIDDAFGA